MSRTSRPKHRQENSIPERRQYFRIQDQASITISSIGEKDSLSDLFPYAYQLTLLSELSLLDVEGRHQLGQINERDRSLGVYLKTLNRKLETITQLLAQSSIPINPDSVREIDLSEGGVSFRWHEPFNQAQRVGIQMILLPDYVGLILHACVKSCDKLPTEKDQPQEYEVRLAFDAPTESQRHLIAKHVMRKQSRERQKRRQENT
ncbi:MAG: hypothetical protein H7A00_02735 [Hahellaceae bacterium]|nr:hypothetical protein [Hahellaceae bacterium]